MSRAAETLASIPLATLSIMSLCIITYLYQMAFDPNLHEYTMCPRLVLYLHEYYRFITSALFHGSLMHIGMNMMSTMAIGTSLENRVGTFMMGLTILWGILLTSSIYTATSWLLYVIFGYEKMMYQHSVGFSGVIFQLSVLESNLSPNRTRSLFGVFQVSSKMYPWALLVVLQFVMPHISFLGHLSGILLGTLQLHGALDIIFPSDTYLQHIETLDALERITSKPGFIRMPESGSPLRNVSRDAGGFLPAIFGAFGALVQFIFHVCETIKFAIFGRGAAANENIQLPALWGSADNSTMGAGSNDNINDIYDDEAAGLPLIEDRSGLL
jgi:rhomboid domain-containing protein 1